jgi:hypothetical protein
LREPAVKVTTIRFVFVIACAPRWLPSPAPENANPFSILLATRWRKLVEVRSVA